jgi:D-alanyl-D-alanine carboxypeptidase/D-alanyl-D-alanine-endopeptidase (penicillin-binding protein 4)
MLKAGRRLTWGRAASAIMIAAATILLNACASRGDLGFQSLDSPELKGSRIGLMVRTLSGQELISIRPDERFIPASNTKLFVTAAAFHALEGIASPDSAGATTVRLEPSDTGPPDLVLVGGGDLQLSDRSDCRSNCLRDLALQVAQSGVTDIRSVIVDGRLFPDERWSPGWSWNNLQNRSGAPLSALTIDGNEARIVVSPQHGTDNRPSVRVALPPEMAVIDNEALIVDGEDSAIVVERKPGSRTVSVRGTIGDMAPDDVFILSVEDPLLFAGLRFQAHLAAAGVNVGSDPKIRRRGSVQAAGTASPTQAGSPSAGVEIARLTPPPIAESLIEINKASQNVEAEVLLRRLGLLKGQGAAEDGLAIIHDMLAGAGTERWTYDIVDGSGMSIYNRVTPRMMTDFLIWANAQPWGEAWKATLPVGGIDGTLRRRFSDGPLRAKVSAKTGSLNAVNALAGYMTAKSGRQLVFAAYLTDYPMASASAAPQLDRILDQIAERY